MRPTLLNVHFWSAATGIVCVLDEDAVKAGPVDERFFDSLRSDSSQIELVSRRARQGSQMDNADQRASR